MKIIQDFIPKGSRNRPGRKNEPEYLTRHDTGNTNPYADAAAHAAYLQTATAARAPVSWHVTVDEDGAIQHIPFNEDAYHAGDGAGPGNRNSIGVEACMNAGASKEDIEANTVKVFAKLIREIKTLKPFPECVKQHHDWSGKNCPATLRATKDGWNNFIKAIAEELKPKVVPAADSKLLYRVQTGAFASLQNAINLENRLKAHKIDTYLIEAGGLYKVQVGAYSVKANADNMAKRLKGLGFATYITTKGGKPVNYTPPKPTPAPAKQIKKGSKVRVKQGTRDFDSNVPLNSKVFENIYDVISISGNRVVIGVGKAVTAAVHIDSLIK